MKNITPQEYIENTDERGYTSEDYALNWNMTMTIGRRMTRTEAAAAICFMLGTNGTALGFLAEDGETQLRGEHIFDHAREFILKNREEKVCGTKQGDTITVNGKVYREVG